MTNYRFPTRRPAASRLKGAELDWLPRERVLGMIGNHRAGSYAEYIVALVLWHLRLEFHYQYRVHPTPYTIDFYIFNGTEWVPLEVKNFSGDPKKSKDRLRYRIIENALNRDLNTIYDTQTMSFEMALDAVKAIL